MTLNISDCCCSLLKLGLEDNCDVGHNDALTCLDYLVIYLSMPNEKLKPKISGKIIEI